MDDTIADLVIFEFLNILHYLKNILLVQIFLLSCMLVTLYFAKEVPLEANHSRQLSDSSPLLHNQGTERHESSHSNYEKLTNGRHSESNIESSNSYFDYSEDINSNISRDNSEHFNDGPGAVLVNILTSLRHLPPGMHAVLLVMALTWVQSL